MHTLLVHTLVTDLYTLKQSSWVYQRLTSKSIDLPLKTVFITLPIDENTVWMCSHLFPLS